MGEIYRTPEARFQGLPDFDFEARYREIEGLRLAYLDEGEGPAVVFLHGEPTWSFLWRKVLPPVAEAGFRCIAPDYAGFGRSDKPTDVDWYTYDRHVDLMRRLLESLELGEVTLVLHDWGGPIGLRLAAEMPGFVKRLVVMETGPFTGYQPMSDAWFHFRDFVATTEDVPVGRIVRGGCFRDPGQDVIAAYEAPFPVPESKAGVRAFPAILPTEPDAPGAAEGRAVVEALIENPRPTLVLWADSDPVLPLETAVKVAGGLGLPKPELIADASHYLQEDAGPEIGRRIAEWLTADR
jgi:haloalkane dehalogenase